MEGLLIAEVLRDLAPRLPAERLAWRFPDDRTAVLPLAGDVSLWIVSRPPNPRMGLRPGAPEASRSRSPFQAQLAAHAVGPLLAAEQAGLDRVATLRFGAGDGFVPRPAVDLVLELTGRNANLLLVDLEGRIVGVERQVSSDRNRYRELRSGIRYRPPPPYRKLDPRDVDDGTLHQALAGKDAKEVRKVIDGIGPQLGAALEASVQPGPDGATSTAALVREIRRMVPAPADYLAQADVAVDVGAVRREERLARWRAIVRSEVERELRVARKRRDDAEQAIRAEADATELRREADLLLAYAHTVPPGAATVTLTDFDGAERAVTLDPRLDAPANARARYDRAKRREARAERARRQLADLRQEARDAEARRDGIDALPEADLRRAAEAVERDKSAKRAGPSAPGVRFRDPRGFEVIVGRNARENDIVTFRLARSRDLWFHAQGFRGSHVVVRSEGREVPFETVLFAARLAAGYSEARDEDGVPVDYTQRKHVWKVKGGPAGAVHFSQHRTVFVTPARDDAGANGEPRRG